LSSVYTTPSVFGIGTRPVPDWHAQRVRVHDRARPVHDDGARVLLAAAL